MVAVLTNSRDARMGGGKPVRTVVHEVHWSASRTPQQIHQGIAGYLNFGRIHSNTWHPLAAM